MKIRYNPASIDVVDIVRQIKQHLQEKQQELKTEDRIRIQIENKLKSKLDTLSFPKDVKEELAKSNFNFIFSADSLITSERPVIGAVFSLTRRIFKPFLKFIINIDPLIHHIHRQSYLLMLYKESLIDLNLEVEKLRQESSKRNNDRIQKRRFIKPRQGNKKRGERPQ
jgi:hypothetical protein